MKISIALLSIFMTAVSFAGNDYCAQNASVLVNPVKIVFDVVSSEADDPSKAAKEVSLYYAKSLRKTSYQYNPMARKLIKRFPNPDGSIDLILDCILERDKAEEITGRIYEELPEVFSFTVIRSVDS